MHGTLNSALVFDTCQEMYFVYAKIQPFIAVLREKLGAPDFLANVQKLVEGSEEGRQRVSRLQARIAARANAPAQSRQLEIPNSSTHECRDRDSATALVQCLQR